MSDLSPEVRVPPMTEREATEERVLRNQERMIEVMEKLHNDLSETGTKLEEGVSKLSSAFWGLMKVPVACVMVGVSSWAFMYSNKISETTWLVIMAAAVFPWMKESLEGLAKIWTAVRGGRDSDAGGGK
jgi:hypothetical protein